jgi:Flp pilus assembly pilin Flp
MVDRFNIFVGQLYSRLQREEGQGMVEYALVLGLVVAIGVAVTATGIAGTIAGKFSSIASGL